LLETCTRPKIFGFGLNGSDRKGLRVAKKIVGFLAFSALVTVTDEVYLPVGKVMLLSNAPMRVSPADALKSRRDIDSASIGFVQSRHLAMALPP